MEAADRPSRFRARRHARGHLNSPRTVFIAARLSCSILAAIYLLKNKKHNLHFAGCAAGGGGGSPVSLSRSTARTRTPKTVPGLFLSLARLSCSILAAIYLFENKKHNLHLQVVLLSGGGGSPVSLPRSTARTRTPKTVPGLFLSLRDCPVRFSPPFIF